MTKLKNTKKGMAKKALSISLVAAMLATSNVPVWAAEFSDGADVVETFSDEAVVMEASAPVEEMVEAPELNAALGKSYVGLGEEISFTTDKLTKDAEFYVNWFVTTGAPNWSKKTTYTEIKAEGTEIGYKQFTGAGKVENVTQLMPTTEENIGKYITAVTFKVNSAADGGYEVFGTSKSAPIVYSENVDDYYTNDISTPGWVVKGNQLTYTGAVTATNGAKVTKLAWYGPNGEKVGDLSEDKVYYATVLGDYKLVATVNIPVLGATNVEVGTIYSATEDPSEAITGDVVISNDADNQWGYTAKAEYDTKLPEGEWELDYIWETKNPETGAWETEDVHSRYSWDNEYLTDTYQMKEADCGKALRVRVELVKWNDKETVVTKESNSFKVAPLKIAAEDIVFENPNFGIWDVDDEPNPGEIRISKKDSNGNYIVRNRKLKASEYEVISHNITEAGVRTVTIKLKGAFEGQRTEDVKVGEYSLVNCKITLDSKFVPFVGDGKYAVPTVKEVKWANGITLVEGRDYIINENAVEDCVEAGDYTQIPLLKGMGDFTNSYGYVDFTIVSRSMENCQVIWTGKPVIKGEKLIAGTDVRDIDKVHFVVVDEKGYVLIPDRDYTYDKDGIYDVSQQKCKVVVTAKDSWKDTVNGVYRDGNYYGKAESDFVTVGTNLENELTNYVNSVVSAQTYTGKPITFSKLNKISAAAVKAVNGGKASFKDDLEVGVDFDIVYKNNVDAYLLKDENGNLLACDKDYTDENGVHYYHQNKTDLLEANDDPQAPQVYLVFKGKFSGETTPVRFAINQRHIEEVTTDNTVVFTPDATDANAMKAYADQVEAIQFKDVPGNALKNTVDYTYDYYYVNDAKDVSTENGQFKLDMLAHTSKVMLGSNRVTVYDGNYYGDYTYVADVVARSLTAKSITVADIENQKYNGKLIEPKVTVKDGNYTLVEGVDYKLSYKNNRSAGTATVVITGLATTIDRYKDSITKTFTIENKSIADAKLMKKGAYNSTYTDLSKYKDTDYVLINGLYDNDRPVKAQFDVVDANNNLLIENYDYTVAYENNTKVGTAKIIITGKGDYEGTLEGSFEILGKGISGHFVEKTIPAQTYTGSAIEPKVTFVPNTPNLVEGRDYEIIYEYNVNPGKCVDADSVDDKGPKAVAHGIGQYAGYVKLGFEIKKADISIANVTAEDAVYAGGKIAESKITVTNPASGKALIEGTDYSVEYVSGKEVGDTGKAILTLLNNACYTFSGDASNNATITVTYNIIPRDLKDVTVDTVADQTVTGEQIKPQLTVKNGDVVLHEGLEYQVAYGENKEVGVGTAVITPVEGNKNYTGSKEVTFNIVPEEELVGKAMISEVRVRGNNATVILSGNVDNARGYDYVISTEEDYKNGRLPNGINKNQLVTHTDYHYLPAGTYYAYCHAWKRGEDGKKVFGAWSNIVEFEVTATTPATPKITDVKVSGKDVTVTYTNCKDATGYDVVLGKSARLVNGEMRPTNYGSYVAKAYKNGTVKVTFKNVKAGTYYAGLHAYNRTSEDGKKVFSPWSAPKKITVK